MNKTLMTSFIVAVVFGVLFFITPTTANAYSFKSTSFRTTSYKTYSRGGSLYVQKGYFRSSGTYVQPYLKTRADNTIYNNRKYILGY